MTPYQFNSLPVTEQAKLKQWQIAAGLVTVVCGVGMLLMAAIQAWLFESYPHVWSWLIDMAISGLVMALGAGILRNRRECLTGSLAVLVLFLVSQLMLWASQQRVGSFFLLLVPTAALLVNYWTHRLWSSALAFCREQDGDG